MNEKVLVVGSGGREHAIIRQLSTSSAKLSLYCTPGNPGTSELASNISLDIGDNAEIVKFCVDNNIDLVIIGPEDPLINGMSDALRNAGILVFGPGKAGARLEGDKEYAKELMAAANVPTASYKPFSSYNAAVNYIETADFPLVVKACGAAQGKGVAVCETKSEAEKHLSICFNDNQFGDAGQQVIIEDCLVGPELSVLVITDGDSYALLAPSRDHKRVGEADTGPNTGGMGAFATGELVPDGLGKVICDQVVDPVLAELRKREIDYRGVLYVGLMLTENGPQVLEFNTRFGDPETQVVLPLLNCDFFELTRSVAEQKLTKYLEQVSDCNAAPLNWPGNGITFWGKTAMVVVGTAAGYPGSYPKGDKIDLPDDSEYAWIVHAGTKIENEKLVTSGGRVLGAVGIADEFTDASKKAYALISETNFKGMNYRSDIGAGFNKENDDG
jgi:phosphoribosylamine--glycine ligase